MNDSTDVAHHGFEGRAVGDVSDNRFFVVGHVLHRADVGQPQVTPVGTQAIPQGGADSARGACDQNTVSPWIDHERSPVRER